MGGVIVHQLKQPIQHLLEILQDNYFFINGIVKIPVVITFATELPDMEPKRPLAIQEIFADPPVNLYITSSDKSIINLPKPDFSARAPKRINRTK